MIHDPSTIAMGNAKDMEKAIETLNEVKASIVNAYAAKTGMRQSKIAELMSNETWMNAKKAVELGFADVVLYENKPEPDSEGDEPSDHGDPVKLEARLYSSRLMDQAILNRLRVKDIVEEKHPDLPTIGMDGKTADGAVPYQILMNQLDFLR